VGQNSTEVDIHLHYAGLSYAQVGRPLIAAGTTIVVDGKA
jgi:hypothetical protein